MVTQTKPLPYKQVIDKETEKNFKAALRDAKGYISRAAKVLGISPSWAAKLCERFGLRDFARRLRKRSGGGAFGPPPGKLR